MSLAESRSHESSRTGFYLIVLGMLGIAVAQLFVIPSFTTVYLGLPLWMWLHLGIVAILFVFAWFATELGSPARRV